MADEEPLDRKKVISLIGKHAQQLAALASKQGCFTLYYLLQTAHEQAEKELAAARGNVDRTDGH